MRLQVLGSAGGLGGGGQTVAYLIDTDILIDAGTGVSKLPAEVMGRIDHVFLTHAHLDHTGGLPLLVDAARAHRRDPIIVHAPAPAIEALHEHIFNWSIWPDFTTIPSAKAPAMRFEPIAEGETVETRGRRITALPARHTVPTVGYLLDSGIEQTAISGDTTVCEPFWQTLNTTRRLGTVIVEMSYHDGDAELAWRAGHLCPSMLGPQLAELRKPVRVLLTHIKPSDASRVLAEIAGLAGRHTIEPLREGQVLVW